MKLEVNLPDDLAPLLDKVASESDRFQTRDDFVHFAVTSLVLELFVQVFSEDDGGENETSECGLVGRENSRDLTRFLQEKERKGKGARSASNSFGIEWELSCRPCDVLPADFEESQEVKHAHELGSELAFPTSNHDLLCRHSWVPQHDRAGP